VAAAGSAGIVTAEAVKPGAIVLDVGVSRETDPETGKSKIVGDVDPAVAEVAAWVSPNPGGVGPMTRALLLKNVVDTAVRAARALAFAPSAPFAAPTTANANTVPNDSGPRTRVRGPES